MRLKRPKWLLVQLIGAALVVGVLVLAYFQFQWIRSATEVEHQRILREIRLSADRALDEAFDEIRALISFAYVSPENLEREIWDEVGSSLDYWADQSSYPELLDQIMLVPTSDGKAYRVYDTTTTAFIPASRPDEFASYNNYLSGEAPTDAYRRAYPELLTSGYFMLPIFDEMRSGADKTPVSILAVKINLETLLSEVLPVYLESYLSSYRVRVTSNGSVHYTTLTPSESNREPDVALPMFGSIFFDMGNPRIWDSGSKDDRNPEFKNPVTRFWFMRTAGVPEREGSERPDFAMTNAPRLEVFNPDRSLNTDMKIRQTTNIMLSVGTLIVLLAAYFVLYLLLARTDTLRTRERDFVTSMSHELRTPLSVISATSDNLVEGIVESPERIRKYGGLIKTQSQRLGKMVESILLYSGIEMMDADKMRAEEINLSDFFSEIVTSLAPAAEESRATIVFSKDTRLDSVVLDADALRIVAENLIVNALRHGVMPDSEKDAAKAEVRVVVRIRPPRSLILTVEDDGPGISPAEIKAIFEAFSRGEKSKSEQVPGSGLGLHIVRRVCTQLGGSITVDSPYRDMARNTRRGARFTAKIPFRVERRAGDTR